MRYGNVCHVAPFQLQEGVDKGWPRVRVVGPDDWMWIEYNSANVLDYMYERGIASIPLTILGSSLQAFKRT